MIRQTFTCLAEMSIASQCTVIMTTKAPETTEKIKSIIDTITSNTYEFYPNNMANDLIYCACLLQNASLVDYLLRNGKLYYNYAQLRYAVIIACDVGDAEILDDLIDYIYPDKLDIDDWSLCLWEIAKNNDPQMLGHFLDKTLPVKPGLQELKIAHEIITKLTKMGQSEQYNSVIKQLQQLKK